MVFKLSFRSRVVALKAGDPDLGGCADGEAGVNARPEGTCDRCDFSRSVDWWWSGWLFGDTSREVLVACDCERVSSSRLAGGASKRE